MKNKTLTVIRLLITSVLLLLVVTSCKKDNDPSVIMDGDGNLYTPVTIGTQTWLKENLKTTKYNDGSNIQLAGGDDAWHTASNQGDPAFCWYDNDNGYKDPYGALYNWYAVNTGKLCPKGYRVSGDGDWDVLIDFVGDNENAGGKLKATGLTYWDSPNTDASDEYGFTAVGGGYREAVGEFLYIKLQGFWWTGSEYGQWVGITRIMTYGNKEIFSDGDRKGNGCSVRCIKN